MRDVADSHLLLRNGTWYFRRRVPKHLVAQIGKDVVQHSLGTKSKTEARKRRDIENVRLDAQFEALENRPVPASEQPQVGSLSPARLWAVVRDYVERKDLDFQRQYRAKPPSLNERADLIVEDEIASSILASSEDPRRDEWLHAVETKLLGDAGLDPDSIPLEARPQFSEIVRRGLVELTRRKLAAYADRFEQAFFDHAFDPKKPPSMSFRDLADQYLAGKKEEHEANGTSQKSLEKIRSQVALLRELVGDQTPVEEIDYDECLRVRSRLARIPSNRTKIYPRLNIEKAIAKAEKDRKPLMSPVTQANYLDRLRDILDLGTHKRLLPSNPASGLRPLKRDDVRAEDKRLPFTLDQLETFFECDFYRSCAPDAPKPYRKPDRDWRFWMPFLALFMGMRPNEIAQMLPSDVKRTKQGTWFVDIVATGDDEEATGGKGRTKTLKTGASRRKIPVHPELLALGFIQFAKHRQKAKAERLFGGLKADKYGNLATYALKRFRDTFLPQAITLEQRQTFYSFRHSFRDALRRSNATPDALKALGGWSQGSLTSDAYGSKADPDLYVDAISKIEFPGMDLSHLKQAESQSGEATIDEGPANLLEKTSLDQGQTKGWGAPSDGDQDHQEI